MISRRPIPTPSTDAPQSRTDRAPDMAVSLDLLMNAMVAGLLLGGFYAAVTVGVTISFGMLDIVNIAHPAFIMLGLLRRLHRQHRVRHRPDPGRRRHGAGLLSRSAWRSTRSTTMPSSGAARSRCGASPSSSACCSSPRSALILVFGVDYRFVEAPYIGPSLHLGFVDLPLRMLVPFLVSLVDGRRCCSSSWRAPSSAAPSWRCRRTGWRCS